MVYMKPMKGVKVEDNELHRLRFPLLASLKYDGIRCIVPENRTNTNRMKSIPNKHIRSVLENGTYTDLDGELIVGPANKQSTFNTTQSAVMSIGGTPDFKFYVFDMVMLGVPYYERRSLVREFKGHPHIHVVKQYPINSLEELLEFESLALSMGYEGIMIRDPYGEYKFGKCTLNQGWLLKRKPFLDDEAIITGLYEQMENTNTSKINSIGLNKRSKEKVGMVPKGTLGGFFVTSKKWGDFKVATGKGLTQSLRQKIWDDRDSYKGRYITFKYLPVGVKDKPRSPIFLRFRDKKDITAN